MFPYAVALAGSSFSPLLASAMVFQYSQPLATRYRMRFAPQRVVCENPYLDT